MPQGVPTRRDSPGSSTCCVAEDPTYLDVRGYLEPAAVRRLGFEYVHAPESWVESLPDEGVDRLNDASLFELLVRDETESLYRVLPAFLSLETPPAPASYEALRQAVPRVHHGISARDYLNRITSPSPRGRCPMPGCSASSTDRRCICGHPGGPSRSATTCPTS